MIDDKKFRQIRRIVALFKYSIAQIEEIKFDHDKSIEKLEEALFEIQEDLKEKGVDIELCHLATQAKWLDEDRLMFLRKKMLDFGNNIRREAEQD